MATIANNGVYNKAHFVREVDQRDPKTGKFVPVKNTGEKLKPVEAFSPDVAAAVQNVMQKIPGINGLSLDDGRKAIGKTGTWEFTGEGGKPGYNGDAWMVGGTKKLAASVWVGREKVNKKTKKTELLPIFRPGTKTPMNGGSTPGKIWKTFMDGASKAIKADNEPFLPNSTAFVDPNKKGNGEVPPPPPPPAAEPATPNPLCAFLPNCDENNDGNGNGNGDNGGQEGQPTQPGPGLPNLPGNGDNGGGTDNGGGAPTEENTDDGN